MSSNSDASSNRRSPAAARGLSVNTSPSPSPLSSSAGSSTNSSDLEHSDTVECGDMVGGTRARQRRFLLSVGDHWTLDVTRTPLLIPSALHGAAAHSPCEEGLKRRSATGTPHVYLDSTSTAEVAATLVRSHVQQPQPQWPPEQTPHPHKTKEARGATGLKCMSLTTIVAIMSMALLLLCLFVGVPLLVRESPSHVAHVQLEAAPGAVVEPSATEAAFATAPAPAPSTTPVATAEAAPSSSVAGEAVPRHSPQPSSPAVESEKEDVTASTPAAAAIEPQPQQQQEKQEKQENQSSTEMATASTPAEPPPQQTERGKHGTEEKKPTDGTPEQVQIAKYLNLSVDFVASMERKYECLLPVPLDTPMPRLVYQLAYDFDQALNEQFEEHRVWYTLASGTLLGSERHKGMLPWDDDLDVATECPGPVAPCWAQWYNPQSVLRKSLRRRNLEVAEMQADSLRHMLKVYSTDPARYVAVHDSSQTSYPAIDVFFFRRLRCNVSDHARDVSRNIGRVENTDPHDAVLRAKLEIYETDVLAYLSRPTTVDTDPLTGVQTGPCSVQTHSLPEMMFINEVFPRKRVMFGTVEVWAPAKGVQIVRRWIGHSWAHSFSRTFLLHHPGVSAREAARLRAEGKPVPSFDKPWTNPGSAFADQTYCGVDIFDLLEKRDKHPEDRALADEIKWILRPAIAAPDAVVRDSSGELASKRLMDDPALRALATEAPKAPEDVTPWTEKQATNPPSPPLPMPNLRFF